MNAPGGRTFVYNQNNRLTQVKNGESVIAEYAYDGFGRRVMKTVGSEITHYHYDLAGQLICETDGSGDAVRDYVYLNGEPVAMQLYGDDAGWYYFVNDHLGTPQKVVNDSGAVVWEAGYLPFGEARLLVADIDNNLRFPGQYFDGETGLHYNWHRYYDPESGRYWSADPIGLSGGINLFGYVSGNPINIFDLYGLEGTIRNPPGFTRRVLDSVYTRAHQLAHPEQWGPGQGVDNLMFLADIASIGLGIGAEKVGMNCLAKIAAKSGRRTWQKAGISAADAKRIQNAANRTKQKITVVGSRAKGNSKATSDWDYILEFSKNKFTIIPNC